MISKTSIYRLCRICSTLELLKNSSVQSVSSSELAKITGFSAHSIRKDINSFGQTGSSKNGYVVEELLLFLKENLGLKKEKKVCIVGLGRLGLSLMKYPNFKDKGFNFVAGFDSSTNKIETLEASFELFPFFNIEEIVRQKNIEIAILTVPKEEAQVCAEKLAKGGIKAILNFAPTKLEMPPHIIVKDLYVTDDLMFLSAMLKLKEQTYKK